VTNKPPFDNELARQAMAWAVPYDQIIEQIYPDRATRMVGSVNPRTKGYSTDGLPVYQYDRTGPSSSSPRPAIPTG